MSDEQTEVNEKVAKLAALERGDVVDLVTDGGSFAADVTAVETSDDAVVVRLDDGDADQRLRVRTEKCRGWLDPLVDAYASDAPDLLRPVGSVVDVHLVSAGSDQPTRQRRA